MLEKLFKNCMTVNGIEYFKTFHDADKHKKIGERPIYIKKKGMYRNIDENANNFE